MKYTIKPLVVIFLTVLTLIGCEQDQVPPEYQDAVDVQQHGELEFIYQVTDMEGNPKNTFQEGENFMLNFTVKNPSKEVKVIEQEVFPMMDNFFAVYQTGDEGKSYIGKPFKVGPNTMDYRVLRISPAQQIIYQVPWISGEGKRYELPASSEGDVSQRNYEAVEMQRLLKGQYVSAFRLEYGDHQLEFELSFSVD